MKAEIVEIVFLESFTSKYGELHKHKITFIDESLNRVTALHNSKTKLQTYFKEGEIAEFDLEELTGKEGKKFYKIRRPKPSGGNPNYNREKKKEQTKYSGFAMSYAKDLVVAGKLEFKEMLPAAEKLFWHMVNLDKKLDS